MALTVNEQTVPYENGLTVSDVRAIHKPDADVLILNGAVVQPDHPVSDGDRVVLITRGATPTGAELEAALVARHTPGVHERVRSATIGIAGVGGLGSTVACCLARLGIGTLVLADHDVVEPSNLNRQQYFLDQLGRPKSEAIAETLRRINPYVKVSACQTMLTRQNVPNLFAECAIVIECFDRPEAKAMALECARISMREKQWIMASGLAGYEPTGTLEVRRLFDNVVVVGDGTSEACPGRGLMSPRVTVCAGMQANVALRILMGVPAEAEGKNRCTR